MADVYVDHETWAEPGHGKEPSIQKKSDPIIIEAAGMRIWVDYHRALTASARYADIAKVIDQQR